MMAINKAPVVSAKASQPACCEIDSPRYGAKFSKLGNVFVKLILQIGTAKRKVQATSSKEYASIRDDHRPGLPECTPAEVCILRRNKSRIQRQC